MCCIKILNLTISQKGREERMIRNSPSKIAHFIPQLKTDQFFIHCTLVLFVLKQNMEHMYHLKR